MVRKTTRASKIRKATQTEAPLKTARSEDIDRDLDDAETDVDAETATDATKIEPALGKRELIDRVVAASGIKKKAAKPVIEAMLKELGDAVSRGETLNLQPFGKANIKRHKDLEHAEIIELRLRRSKLAIKAAEATDEPVLPVDPLAEAAE